MLSMLHIYACSMYRPGPGHSRFYSFPSALMTSVSLTSVVKVLLTNRKTIVLQNDTMYMYMYAQPTCTC